jgi:hypothetical protein
MWVGLYPIHKHHFLLHPNFLRERVPTMIKELLFGTTVALCVAGQASALSLTLLEDNRFIEAEAFAGEDSDFSEDSPVSPFANFNSDVSAMASEFGLPCDSEGNVETHGFGASSFGTAQQTSQVTATAILVSGSAFARGDHGELLEAVALSDSDSDGGFGSFNAYGESVLEILFSIDEAAAYDIDAFISAGTEAAFGPTGNDVFNFAEMILYDEDAGEAVFEYEVSDGSMDIDESGVIGPGTYRFTASAYAEVFGGFLDVIDWTGDSENTQQPISGYRTNASFGGIGLSLVRADQPIPEPVTTTLIGLSLGALVLRTTRRRKA